MTYACDTHAFVRWATRGRTLGRAAARIFREAERRRAQIHLSSISLFEIALLIERGRLRPALDWNGWMAALRSKPGLVVEPFTADDAIAARALAILADPFDRMIVATAIRLGVPLITADGDIGDADVVRVVW